MIATACALFYTGADKRTVVQGSYPKCSKFHHLRSYSHILDFLQRDVMRGLRTKISVTEIAMLCAGAGAVCPIARPSELAVCRDSAVTCGKKTAVAAAIAHLTSVNVDLMRVYSLDSEARKSLYRKLASKSAFIFR